MQNVCTLLYIILWNDKKKSGENNLIASQAIIVNFKYLLFFWFCSSSYWTTLIRRGQSVCMKSGRACTVAASPHRGRWRAAKPTPPSLQYFSSRAPPPLTSHPLSSYPNPSIPHHHHRHRAPRLNVIQPPSGCREKRWHLCSLTQPLRPADCDVQQQQ